MKFILTAYNNPIKVMQIFEIPPDRLSKCFSNFEHQTKKYMNYTGLIIAIITFLIIGAFHPIVIKCEYYFGTKCWWVFALLGVVFVTASLLVSNVILSPALGVLGCTCLWSILEIFEQKQRVEKGWFPMNPKRKNYYNKKE